MRKTSFLYWFAVPGFALLFVSNVYFFTRNKSLEKELTVKVADSETEKQLSDKKILLLETYTIMSAKSTGRLINGNTSLVNIKNKKRTVKEIFARKTPCLIFRYSQSDCSPCVNTTFEYLWKLKNSVDPDKLQIVIIPYYAELRAMIVQNSQSFKNQFPFYLTNEKGLGLPIDKDYVPYMFILDENKRTCNMFVVDMMFQPLLEKYFNVLIENYR